MYTYIEAPIEAPLKPLRKSQHYHIEGFKEGLRLSTHDAERRQSHIYEYI